MQTRCRGGCSPRTSLIPGPSTQGVGVQHGHLSSMGGVRQGWSGWVAAEAILALPPTHPSLLSLAASPGSPSLAGSKKCRSYHRNNLWGLWEHSNIIFFITNIFSNKIQVLHYEVYLFGFPFLSCFVSCFVCLFVFHKFCYVSIILLQARKMRRLSISSNCRFCSSLPWAFMLMQIVLSLCLCIVTVKVVQLHGNGRYLTALPFRPIPRSI